MAQLKQDLEKEHTSAVTQQEEWNQKLLDAQTGSSAAVDEVTKQLTEKLEQQAQAHQQAVDENEKKLKEALGEVDTLKMNIDQDQSASEEVRLNAVLRAVSV